MNTYVTLAGGFVVVWLLVGLVDVVVVIVRCRRAELELDELEQRRRARTLDDP